MARPLTKGPVLSIRLPLDAHEELIRRADAHGESPRHYVLRNLTAALTARVEPPRPSPPPTGYRRRARG